MRIPDITVTNILIVNRYRGTRPTWSATKRPVHTLCYQLSGVYDHSFPNKTLTFREDTLVFLNANEPYNVTTREVGVSISFHFTCLEDDLPESFAFDCKNEPAIKALFEKAYHDWNKTDEAHRYQAFANLYQAILKVNQIFNKKYASASTRKVLENALMYINENLSSPITVIDISEAAGVGERQLRKIFNQQLHTTPSEYLLSRRINLACSYLKTRAYSLQEIAEMVGFQDKYYFSRCFKRILGVSPRKYQNNTYIGEV